MSSAQILAAITTGITNAASEGITG